MTNLESQMTKGRRRPGFVIRALVFVIPWSVMGHWWVIGPFLSWGVIGHFATAQEKRDPTQAREPGRLDLKSLGVLLTELGGEPKLVDDNFQKIRWTTPNWASPVWVSVSGNKKTVWLYTEFELRPDFEKAPAGTWRAILEKNDSIGPSHFSLDEKGKRLTFRRPVVNADVTAVQLRKELNEFVDDIQKTQDLWRASAFLPAMTPEAQKVVDRLAGKWQLTASINKGAPLPADALARFAFEFDKNQMRALHGGKEALKVTIYVEVLDGKTTIDLVSDSSTDSGILKLEGDTLTVCTSVGGKDRPSDFVSSEKSNTLLMVLKRQKP